MSGSIRPSISTWSFERSLPLADQVALAAEAGFAGIELAFDAEGEGPLAMGSTPADAERALRAVQAGGLAVSGLASGLYWGSNPASNDPGVRERARRILARHIECAALIGVDAVLVIPAVVSKDKDVAYDDAWARAREFVESALPLAERHRLAIGIENVWNGFLLSPLEMRAFVDSFASPWVFAWYDVGNTLASGTPEHWIRILGRRIRRLHVKDYRRAVGGAAGFVDLLAGDVEWPAVMAALRAVGYSGWCAAEICPPYRHAPQVLIANTARALAAILAM